jgi:Na+-translocating ferredoxin:NAD+ oxidoreductase subunit E
MFASKNQPVRAVLDGFGVGTGFLVVLFTLGGVREVIGSGTFLGAQVMPAAFQPWLIMVLPGGAFLTLGVLMGLANAYVLHRQKVERQGQQTKLAGTVEKEVAV